ncbi:MAG: glutathione S-transferase N-terminal domain-containing protein, partial [Candidatus Limnocylindrus sp.]
MGYKLYYFPIRGRGEQVRLLLHALEIPFEDVLVKREQYLEMKAEGPGTLYFGSLPMLEDGLY